MMQIIDEEAIYSKRAGFLTSMNKTIWKILWYTKIYLFFLVFRIPPKTSEKQIVSHHLELTVLSFSSRTISTWTIMSKKPQFEFRLCWLKRMVRHLLKEAADCIFQ